MTVVNATTLKLIRDHSTFVKDDFANDTATGEALTRVFARIERENICFKYM
jgi:hypothetical protein